MAAQRRSWLLIVEVMILAAIVAMAAALRLTDIGVNPGWYTDEATHLDIAANLIQGEWRYMVIQDSVLIFARLPLFEGLLAGTIQLFGSSMLTLRTLVAGLSLLSIILLYLLVRWNQPDDRLLPLTAAALFAIYPEAVLYHRLGFSYHLLTPLLLIIALSLTRYWRTGRRFWLLWAALATGAGLISDVWMAVAIPVMILVVLFYRLPDLLWSLPVMLLPVGIYAAGMLTTAPDAFLLDAAYTLSRTAGQSLEQQLQTLIDNYLTLLAFEPWFMLSLIGLFMLQPVRLRVIALLLFAAGILIPGRVVALHNLSYYYMIPLLPFIALGVAALLRYGAGHIWQMARRWLQVAPPERNPYAPPDDTQPVGARSQTPTMHTARLLVIAILTGYIILILTGPPLVASYQATLKNVYDGYITPIDPFLIDPDTAQQAADIINQRAAPDDLVITSPVVGWMLNARTADMQMVAAAMTQQETPHLPASLPPERFAYPVSTDLARFAVVDNIWRNRGIYHVPGADDMLNTVQTWTPVFEQNNLTVYENPALATPG